MNWLEVSGAVAIYIGSLLALCIASMIIGSRHGNGKGLEGLLFVIYPPIIILILGVIVAVFLLGRFSG